MSLLLNMLSRLVIAFHPRSKSLNFMAAVTICSNFGAQENKVCHCLHCFPIYLPWSNGQGGLECCSSWGLKESDITEQLNRTELMGLDAMIFVFWMLSFKPAFSLSSFTFIKRLLSSSSLSAIRVVSSAYLRLLIFPPGNLDSSLYFIQPSISQDVLCTEVK